MTNHHDVITPGLIWRCLCVTGGNKWTLAANDSADTARVYGLTIYGYFEPEVCHLETFAHGKSLCHGADSAAIGF